MRFLIFLLIGVFSMANHLINSDSPYLLQHKDNPVDWYPWGEEAFLKAKKENKLIFLSIGYSTCHWCHVMERESFENEEIADILNKYYVSIKVDREEMPDIDKYYQKVYQFMHRRAGGWPLTIIMTPDKKPFYSATYLPPHYSQFGPGLKEILLSIAKDWRENPQKIKEIANNFEEFYKNRKSEVKKEDINKLIIAKILKQIDEEFDFTYGGTKGAPKFPMESTLDLMIDVYMITKDEKVKKALDITLTKMAKGGIFDQIEGGFYRYSVDSKWEVPHFEKMLYNNANLPIVYLRWYKLTKNPLYKEVAFRSLDEMIKRFRDENGLFFSASNADSEGIEGKYFVYTYDEVKSAFEIFDNANELMEYFGIKKYGNFNGKNNPTIHGEKPHNYKEALEVLKKIRSKREFPFIDTKKITAWNAMMISALYKASEFDEKYLKTARKTLDKLLEIMYDEKLYHSYNKQEKNKKEALLEDYAYLIKALIDAYEHTYEKRYLEFANKLAKESLKFKKESWYMNEAKNIEADYSDSSYASSLGVLANDFYDLALLNYSFEYLNLAREIIKNGGYYINNYPLFYPSITKAALKDIYKEYVITSKKPLFDYEFDYPYILWKEGEDYEICVVDRCLKRSSSLDELLEGIR
ncbi:thioredoxin domain-containing protein [Caminibacter pacificus]